MRVSIIILIQKGSTKLIQKIQRCVFLLTVYFGSC